MRGLNARLDTASLALVEERVDLTGAVKGSIYKAYRRIMQALCPALHGGHELYRARSDSKLFQQCLLCGYETPGWTIDRRDRKLHLVSGKKPLR